MSFQTQDPNSLPDKTGVYIMKNEQDDVIYVGKAISLKKRVKSYFKDTYDTPKTRTLMKHFHSLEYILTDTEKEALILEANLIKKYRPRYNVRLKDDKRYPYIKITNEDYPRILISRNVTDDGSHYYGPFTDVMAVRKTIKFIKSLFKIRDCKKMDGPCLNYQIKICDAPCDGKISKDYYNEIIHQINLFFQGKYQEIIQHLQEMMDDASANHEFEKAAVLRDQIDSIKEIMEKQKVSFTNKLDQDVIAGAYENKTAYIVVFSIRDGKITGKDDFIMNGIENTPPEKVLSAFIKQFYSNPRYIPGEILLQNVVYDHDLITEWLSERRGESVKLKVPVEGVEYRLMRMVVKNAEVIKIQKKEFKNTLLDLKKYLKLPKLPRSIEAFDISNIAGKEPVASMVVFKNGVPEKSSYRKYKIETKGPDDYAMMREVLRRRYEKLKLEKSEYPDLVIVDGGKGQLNVALSVFNSLNIEIPVMGLAKEFEHIFLPGNPDPIILPPRSQVLLLLQRIRDEAHRFAISYHRKLRSKKISESELDKIKGIGQKRKMKLLKHFGSLKNIKKAEVNQLMEVDSINSRVAKDIYNHFH
ncbi:MAG: excinuclease ABC subunit UvrC [Methanobacteriaceae archaeon]|nr:excinuclease ABC subunit UvrC [Methanobacteriaceae archaeon]